MTPKTSAKLDAAVDAKAHVEAPQRHGLPGRSVRRTAACFVVVPVLLGVAWKSLAVRGDDVTLICEASAWYMDSPITVILGTETRIRAYVQACKDIWPSLEKSLQDRLRKIHRDGRLRSTLPCPATCPPTCSKKAPRVDPLTCGGKDFMRLDEFDPPTRKVWNKAGITPLRLPTVAVEDFDVSKALAIEDKVVGAHNYLWLGASQGSLHHDHEDNILIQLTEEVEGVVVPQNCSGLVLDDPWSPTGHVTTLFPDPNISQKEFRSRPPFYHFYLKPGEGIIVPSAANHRFISKTNARVGLNAFFEPNFQQMQHKDTPYNFYKLVNDDVLAVRVLYLKSQELMYRKHKKVVSMHTPKLPFI